MVPLSSAWAQPKPTGKTPAPSGPVASGDLVARGRALFDDQQYEESIQTLSAALLKPNNTKEQKVEIYRLLALNYITLGRKDEADNAVRGLLSIAPQYTLPASESPRFRDFFAAVRTKWEAEGRPGLVVDTPAPLPAVTILHAPRSKTEAGQLLPVTVRLDDPGGRVKAVEVSYRVGGRGEFTTLEAEIRGNVARAVVPGPSVQPPFVDYFVTAFDSGDTAIASKGDAAAPLRVVVPEASKGWVLPVVIGGSVLAVGAIFGSLALAGVFKSSKPSTPSPTSQDATVSVTIRE